MQVDLTHVSIPTLMENIKRLFYGLQKGFLENDLSDLQFILNIDESVPEIIISDERKLHQIITNLIATL